MGGHEDKSDWVGKGSQGLPKCPVIQYSTSSPTIDIKVTLTFLKRWKQSTLGNFISFRSCPT